MGGGQSVHYNPAHNEHKFPGGGACQTGGEKRYLETVCVKICLTRVGVDELFVFDPGMGVVADQEFLVLATENIFFAEIAKTIRFGNNSLIQNKKFISGVFYGISKYVWDQA